MSEVRPAEVAWYATGRFYVKTEASSPPVVSAFDVGYFLHLAGVGDEIFAGPPGEAAAHFTFAAEPFVMNSLSNGGLSLSLDLKGEFSLYYQPKPASTFDDPASFAAGKRIATFRRLSVVVGTAVGGAAPLPGPLLSLNVFSAQLVWSRPFEHKGRSHDLGELLPHGITQWGTAATEPVLAPLGYASVLPFVGSAIAVG